MLNLAPNLTLVAAAVSVLIQANLPAKSRSGQPGALYDLGLKYANGDGVPKNLESAADLFLRAAKADHTKAQAALCWMSYQGQGIRQDFTEAARWCAAAAERGEASAQYGAGILNREGLGCSKNERKAAQWLAKAAEQGYLQAQYELGVMYQEGVGVQRDPVIGDAWLRKAADGGSLSALRVIQERSRTRGRMRLWSALVGLTVGLLLVLWPERKPQTAWIRSALMALLALVFLLHELTVPPPLLDQNGFFWGLLYDRRTHLVFVIGSAGLCVISAFCAIRKFLRRASKTRVV